MFKILQLPCTYIDEHCTQKRRELRYTYKVMVGKPDGKKSLESSTGKWEDKIRWITKQRGRADAD